MPSLPAPRRHPPTILRRGLSVDIFASAAAGQEETAASASAPSPQRRATIDVPVPLPATLTRVLSGMDKKTGEVVEPDVALRIYKSDGSGALTRVLSSAPGDAASRAAAAADAAAAVAAVLTGGAAHGSSSLSDRLLASGVAGGGSDAAVLVVTSRRRDTCDGGSGVDAVSAHRYTTRESGQPGTLDHLIHVVDAATGRDVSPWTDVPLFVREEETAAVDATTTHPPSPLLANFICEVGRGGRAKLEVDTTDTARHHPLKQDVKNGALRFYPSPLEFNYGLLPRTLEDPAAVWAGAAAAGEPLLATARGDGDPVDVVELSASSLPAGSVTPVVLIGALAMIDGGKLDWKLLALDAASPLAPRVRDATSLETFFPGEIDRIVSFFSSYKGPGVVTWGLGGKPLGAAETAAIVSEACAAFEGRG